ncbi:hypothetical protein ACTHSL_11925, partial [Neisseria sp. P0008.S010]
CGLLEEGAHEKSPKCLGGNLGDFGGDFAKVSGRLKIRFQTAFCHTAIPISDHISFQTACICVEAV